MKRLAYMSVGMPAAASSAPRIAPPADYEVLEGIHACKKAHMVIVDGMSCVSSSSCNTTEDNVVSLMYIVAQGLLVTTKACMNMANGRARKLPRPSVMEHHGSVTKCVAEFVVSRNFRTLYIWMLCQLLNFAWRYQAASGRS